MSPIVRTALLASVLAATLATAPPGSAQQTRTAGEAAAIAEMQSLQARVSVDKRALVAEQLSPLSEAEAAEFWPIYDAHQQALSRLNGRRMDNILAYARVWNAGSMSDSQARSLGAAALQIERDEAAQMERTWKKLKGVLPGAMAVRYLQIESKIRAIVRYAQAAQVPLAD